MSLFAKKPRRNFRKKQVVTEEEEEETKDSEASQKATKKAGEDESAGVLPPPIAEKAPVQPQRAQGSKVTTGHRGSRSLLSFGDDLHEEEKGEVFKLKKSSHSKRMAKTMGREKKDEKEESSGNGGQGSRPESSGEEEEEEEEGVEFSLHHQLSAGFIPDAATIHAVRKKREHARKAGQQATDFIPLSEGAGAGAGRGRERAVARGGSRLVREDEHDRDSEEEGDRAMDFREQSRQMRVLTALEERDSGSDEEMHRWEEEQMTKGSKLPAPTSSATHPLPPSLSSVDQSFLYGSASYPGGDPGSAYSALQPTYPGQYGSQGPLPPSSLQPPPPPSLPSKLVPVTVETLQSRLRNRLDDLRETHSSHSQRLQQVEGDLETARREVERLEGRAGQVGREYEFFQELRGYLRDLLACLTEKSAEIEKLEGAVLSVRREWAGLVAERRRRDVMDQSQECGQSNGRLDSMDLPRQRRSVEREARRRRRREVREKGGVAAHYEGLSSDEELLETDRLSFHSKLEAERGKAADIFSDTVEDFSRLSLIKSRLEEWKYGFPASYEQAFVSLCLPKLFAPFARLQMLHWNPLEKGSALVETMRWFEVLMFYGFVEGAEPADDDEDLQLIPRLVDSTVLPKITSLVKEAWDPLSSTQTQRLVQLLRQLAEDYPTVNAESTNTQALFTAVLRRLRDSIEKDVFIPLFTPAQLEHISSPSYTFYQRQFWNCVKLLGNITAWAGLLAPDTLQELVLDGLLNRYLLLSLQHSPPHTLCVTKAAAIISRLPEGWFNDGSTVTRPLQGLARYLAHLASLLQRASLSGTATERQKARVAIQQIGHQLLKLQAHAEALSVATEHHLGDVLLVLQT